MTLVVSTLTRTFSFNGMNLSDPGPEFSAEEVRDIYSNQYPDIITAAIEMDMPDATTMAYTFVRNVGSKG